MRIAKSVIGEILDHAKEELPLEACGYLGAQDGMITKIYRLTNIDKSRDHFSFDPKEQFAAVKDSRVKGCEVCAVYHSHPFSPARPSQEDIKLAYDPQMSYFIASLAQGVGEVRAFSIKGGVVAEIELEIIND